MQLPPLPATLGVWLATDNYTGEGDDKTISATTLLKSIRQIVLSRRVGATTATININSLIASRIGTAVHTAIEGAWLGAAYRQALDVLGLPSHRYIVNPTGPVPEGSIVVLLEKRTEREIDGWIITGQFDMVLDQQLHDVKTTKAFTILKKLNFLKWAMQGSIYRWLNPEEIQDDRMVVECVVLDWSAAAAAADDQYPQRAWVSVELDLTPVPQTEQFIRQKLHDLTNHINTPEPDLPECTDEDLWRDPPRYAYYANPEATGRATKVFDSLYEANMHLALKGKGRVDTRLGKPTACLYCPAASICTQRLKYLSE